VPYGMRGGWRATFTGGLREGPGWIAFAREKAPSTTPIR